MCLLVRVYGGGFGVYPRRPLPATGIQNGFETSYPVSGVRPYVSLYCLPLNPDLAPIFP
ncbi:MAG: hypothetical protein ACI87O_000417 [Planctomycetota bacterium]|jgi:hypothetical protein